MTETTVEITETESVAVTPGERANLADIVAANDRGETPSKTDLTRRLPSRTRSGHYYRIGTLLERGLVENVSTKRNVTALRATDAGRTLIVDDRPSVEVTRRNRIRVWVGWRVVERTIDGARFEWSYDDEAEAEAHAERIRVEQDPNTKTVAVQSVLSESPYWHEPFSRRMRIGKREIRRELVDEMPADV